jgi:hypothetical protein
MTEMRSAQLLLSASLMCCLGGCATGHRASLEIRPVNAPHMATSDTKAIERGRDLLALGQQAEAISAFRAALREEPNSAEAHNGLAIAYDRIGRKDLARRYFELAVAESPENTKYRTNLARFFESNGQAELALGLTGERATIAADGGSAMAVAGREFEAVTVVAAATEAELATVATNDPIAAIVADLAMLPTTDTPQTAAAAIAPAIAPKLRAAPAVFRPSATTLIKAAPISLPIMPLPDRKPAKDPADLSIDLPRNDRRQSAANGPYIERTSLGEVRLVTLTPSKPTSVAFNLDHLADELAVLAEAEVRRGQFVDDRGLRGRLAIQDAVERAAVDEALAAATSLAAVVDQMGVEFAYISYDNADDSSAVVAA